MIGVLIGNTFEAAADLGGIAAALQLLMPWRFEWLATGVAAIILGLQIWGSYQAIRNIFRVLTLALLAYIASAFLAHPHWGEVLRGTFAPTLKFDKDSLALLVAIIGTSLSTYLYTWQSNQEVEEQIAMGRTRLRDRKGATEAELRESRRDVLYGMIFSNVVMYFIILSTASTLFASGHREVSTAADAAKALGRAIKILASITTAAIFAASLGLIVSWFL